MEETGTGPDSEPPDSGRKLGPEQKAAVRGHRRTLRILYGVVAVLLALLIAQALAYDA